MVGFLVRSLVVTAAGWAAKRVVSRLLTGRRGRDVRLSSQPLSEEWRRDLRRYR